ncbi:enoyl-CoA delta isomerase 1, mitochondrial [Eurytemora carolleeae]|uniref:enoyl-CoA delta isomerase 1, mitochondrial n=1 Tax=Eurytemora carolleeae TaxID=1294199 RepID=UPI000C75D3B3|nr:enoyl-CoA delta isomerase 1, mitochondrial [Eurytemora carolleeae]|eukprot:XP_023329613.1 enoyl-CoA delta isomerase 1, mitochondrial-like [Eurytemora affinis]
MAFVFSSLKVLPVVRSSGVRFFSATASRMDNVETTLNPTGYSVISMNKGPANSLNMEFIQELTQSVRKAEGESKGILLTSSLPTIFCAGLEITEMYKPDMVRLREFWSSLQDLYLALYGCRVPTVAAINGHSPAGGCLLGMCCDYRIMVGPKYSIGLNETQLGIVAPYWFKDTMVQTIGSRQAELSLTLGLMYTTEQALSLGLVDKMVSDKDEALVEAEKMLIALMRVPSEARHVSKMSIRKDIYDRLSAGKQEDIDYFANFIVQSVIQKPLGQYLDALKNKKKKKSV